jgi:NADPH:quinone reductase-like Zn-dependent oxidoreductase
LELSLRRTAAPPPGHDEVVVRIEATPINPSDLGLLLGAADLATAASQGEGDGVVVTALVPDPGMRAMAGRVGQSLAVGNEGAGVVVAAGDAPEAQALLGQTVAVLGGAMYTQYRTLKATDCLSLPPDVTPVDGASCFVNPLTALGMVETMRREGHKALVHTAAASNLGQMLNRICLADGVALVNIVRSPEQAELLRRGGAEWVLDSTTSDFMPDLITALAETGATLAFDAIGGGRLAGQILTAMEAAAVKTAPAYSRYGSSVHKQVYIYGGLDVRPTELTRSFGMAWGVGGWLLTPFLGKIGREGAEALRQRVAREIKTTFSSTYSRKISLHEVLDLEVMRGYARRATGEKYLITPQGA